MSLYIHIYILHHFGKSFFFFKGKLQVNLPSKTMGDANFCPELYGRTQTPKAARRFFFLKVMYSWMGFPRSSTGTEHTATITRTICTVIYRQNRDNGTLFISNKHNLARVAVCNDYHTSILP